jgi:uncharacterized delta-60 repeat protein
MNKYKMLLVIVTALCSLLPTLLYSQSVDTAWVRRYNGPADGSDGAYAIAVDNTGNVYVTGNSYGSGTSIDYATIKYNSAGVQQWVQRYDGSGNADDMALSLAVDGQGNVYVTGNSSGAAGWNDYATIKYNSAGVEQWVQTYDGPGHGFDEAYSLAVDGQNNVYVTGGSWGFLSSYDYATIKYNSAGIQQWVRRYNGPGNDDDIALSLAVDGQGNVYVTGNSSYDYATIKYNSAGVEQWVQRYNGPGNDDDIALSLAVDGQGNVYVTGNSSYDYATIKYNSAGVEQWVQRYNGPGNGHDEARSLAVDGQSNVYVTGYSIDSTTSHDYATIKYNSAGVEEWVQRYNGPGNRSDAARSLAVDGQSNVYVTGQSYGSGTGIDYSTIKYNSAGVEQWVQRYNGTGNSGNVARSIAVDGQSNVYVTGYSIGSGTDFDYATIKYVQTQGIEEVRGQMQEVRELELYPNLAKIYFTVRLPKTVDHSEIKIFDVTGKVVKELESSGNRELRVSLDGIKNGVYFVQLGNQLICRKLVITK